MNLASYIAYASALGIAAAIPGPGVAATVSRALGTGFRRTVPLVLGIIFGDIAYLCLAIAGLALLAHNFATVFYLIRLAGAAYLLWLAFHFWRDGIAIASIEKSAGRRDNLQALFGGFALTLGNPKTIIFYMALLPTVVNLDGVGLSETLVLIILTALVLSVVLLPYAALASRARQALQEPKKLKILSRTAGTAMALTALWVVARS